MSVVAIINRKGGSGKSTLATHLAAHCSRAGSQVLLGDLDPQHSSLAWLQRRAKQELARGAPIAGQAVSNGALLRPSAGITHVVLDTPGGLRGFDLARTVVYAHAVILPVCNSAFDRESAAECFAELQTLPRVASGRCKMAVVGMRLDSRTKASVELRAWAEKNGIPYIGALREAQVYVRNVEQGLTLFDQAPDKVAADLLQWQPILDWLHATWQAAEKADDAAKAPVRPADIPRVHEVSGQVQPVPRVRETVGAVAKRRDPSGPLRWLLGTLRPGL
ncbi:MAG TPA: ParA family protein [Burkholderiaceae bacterium]|jgi:chromosome partitioning protein